MDIAIRELQAGDVEVISRAFSEIGWDKPAAQYRRYLEEQQRGERECRIALVDGVFAGYVTVRWNSEYVNFRSHDIPEINDFNVLPRFRRKGIGTRLMESAEALAATRSSTVGIGVGLYADYGAAQKLYFHRGYVPDGHGVHYDGEPVEPGTRVSVDDDLALYLTKELGRATG